MNSQMSINCSKTLLQTTRLAKSRNHVCVKRSFKTLAVHPKYQRRFFSDVWINHHRAPLGTTLNTDFLDGGGENKMKGKPLQRDFQLICNHQLHSFTQFDNVNSCVDSTDNLFMKSLTCGQCNIGGTNVRNPNSDCDSLECAKTLQPILSKQNNHPGSMYRSFSSYGPRDTNWIILRNFHTSSPFFEDKSKLNKFLEALKDNVKESKEEEPIPVAKPVKQIKPIGENLAPPTQIKVVGETKKSIWTRVVDEVKHYYHGFRLLIIDVRVCLRLLKPILKGESLTRRERRQLVRTTADLFRLLPFLVFIVVPFMEFLLPVALKLFPNMLPSTFKEENKEQEKTRMKLKGKLEMAKFLQDTIEEMALERKGSAGDEVKGFVEFMDKIRDSGELTSNKQILKYSKLFEDEITLDNLNAGMLKALCKLLDIPTIGNTHFLRFQLRMKLRQLEADDRMIKKEGVDALTVWELQDACRCRGMRALGVPEERLKDQLQQWLDLHLVEKVPTSLLLLSRALYMPETLSPVDQLKATISTLPEAALEDTKVTVQEVAGERVDNKAKLLMIKKEEQIIKEEKKEIEAEVKKEPAPAPAPVQKKEEVVLADVAAGTPPVSAAPPILPEQHAIPVPRELEKEIEAPVVPPDVTKAEILLDHAIVAEDMEEVVERVEEITSKDLEEIEKVLEEVSEERESGKLEREEFESLKEDVIEYQENLEDLKAIIVASGKDQEEIKESKAAQRLGKHVNKMITNMGDVMNSLHKEKESLLEDIELKEVKIRRNPVFQDDPTLREEALEQISDKKANIVSINELLLALKRLQKLPDDTKFQKIAEVLDTDQDGVIDINDALKVIELLGQENVKLTTEQVAEISALLRKEAEIEEQQKQVAKDEKYTNVNAKSRTLGDSKEQ